jgi:phosphoribosyl 1,2-cyclic phosphodiesterase
MRIRIWGARGSLPTSLDAKSLQDKLVAALVAGNGRQLDSADKARAFVMQDLDFAVSHTFGGNSPCVQIDTGGSEYLLCDLGTGARAFAQQVMRTHGPAKPQTYHVVMSHLHWDHIMGFPLFAPIYIPGNHVFIYGCHEQLEAAFRRQHAAPSFPVAFDQLVAKIEFVTLKPGEDTQICGVKVSAMLQAHGGDSYGYRFEHAGKSFVYSTDSEHKLEDAQQIARFVDFFRGADLVVFDSMYSDLDSASVKADWGHSSNVVGVELCLSAQAKRLCLFHHEPMLSDAEILQVWRETRRLEEIARSGLPLEVLSAYDGLEIAL